MELYVVLKPDYFDWYKNEKDNPELKFLFNMLVTLESNLIPTIGCDDETSPNYRTFRVSFNGIPKRHGYASSALMSLRAIEKVMSK